MKKFEELDDFKKNSIEKSIELVKMFLYLMKDKEFNEKTISMMKQNYHLMGRHLEDLGVVFDDKDQIRNLNNKIREMEETQNLTGISYNKISAYIEQLNKKIKDKMKEIGISCSVGVSFSPNIIVKIDIFNSENRQPNKGYYQHSSSFNKQVEENRKKHEEFMKNFKYEHYSNDYESLIVIYNEENIEKIKNSVEEVIDFNSANVKVEVQTRFQKDEKGHFKSNIPALKEIEIVFFTLEKDIMLNNAFKSFR